MKKTQTRANSALDTRLRAVCFSALLLLLAVFSACAESAAPKRVLIIHSFGRDFAPFNTVASAFSEELARLLPGPVVFREESLDVERPQQDERPFVDFLLSRYDGGQPDLVITMGAPAMRFYLRSRSRLFPQTPLLVTGIDRRVLDETQLQARDRVVSVRLDIPAVGQSILDLLPNTTLLALVFGGTQHEQFWLKEVQRELAPLSSRITLLPLDSLTLEQLRQRLAALPANSAVLYYMYERGPDGVPQENDRALSAVWKASSAPVFGMYRSQLGSGVVGGPLFDQSQLGIASASLADRMLEVDGPVGDNLTVAAQAPVFDWRELERWGIPESRLPPGAEVVFRPPSLWEEHKVFILAGAGILLFQAALITALMLQHARRRRAENDAVALSGRLLTAHEDERRRLARELHDDLTQRLARLAIEAGRMEHAANAPEGARPLREDLVRLSEDVHALSYRLHPSVLDDLGVVEALGAECDRVARGGRFRVDVEASGVPDARPAETALCLFRIAQEALSNIARHAHASAVTVLLSSRRSGLQLAVSDNGSGFDSGRPRARPSLGLASMRERVRLLRGELDIESTLGRGTTVIAWVPT